MAELTHGIGGNDYRENSVKILAGDPKLLEQALVSDKDMITVAGRTDASYAAGYMFLRYLAKQAKLITGTNAADSITNTISGATVQALAGDDTIENRGANSSILGDAGNDSIRNYSSNSTASGGAGDDTITSYKRGYNNGILVDYNEGKNSLLEGGKGNDRIYNESDDVTIVGGKDNDLISLGADATNTLIKYTSGDGNDSIYGFNLTSTLRFGSSINVSLQTSGSNVIATVGKGKVTLVSAANLSAINIQGSSDSDYIKSTVSGARIDAPGGNDTISNTGSNSSINGGSGNDIIYGFDSKDTLWGNAGNDTLYGGEGADVFCYKSGDGKDVIFGFENDDMLKITSAFSASYNKSNDAVYFKVGSTKNAITLKNFDATTFNINGKSYHISGKKLVK